MQNALIIGIYAPFAAVTAVVLCIELFRRYKRREDSYFILLCFYALGWYAVNISGLLQPRAEAAGYCVVLMLMFVALIAPTLLLFIVEFYKYKLPAWLPRCSPALLFALPAVTAVLAITSDSHHLLTRRLDIVSLSPTREMVVEWGPWFWVHTVYSYLLSMVIIALIIFQHRRVPHFYRLPSTMMVLGVSITLAGNLVTLLQIIPPVIEPTLITMSLSIIFFSLAIFNNNNSKFVHYSKAHIYHYLAEYILVLDEKNNIIDYNKAADEWFTARGIGLAASSLDAVTEKLLQKGEASCPVGGGEGQEGIDIRIRDSMFTIVLNQRIYQMRDPRGDSIGKIVVYSDVTKNRMLIEHLETKAGVDSLTGIPNHMAFVGAKNRLDCGESLPLCAIVCDANHLKRVNDTMGHLYGDLMLQTIASILEGACPKGGFVARTGGDQFIFLLPRTGPEAAERLIGQIRERLGEADHLPFPLSVAFGAAVKQEAGQAMDEIIALADERMYADKRSSRQQAAALP